MSSVIEEIFKCNGAGGHIRITYGSQPCPLSVCHKELEQLQAIVDLAQLAVVDWDSLRDNLVKLQGIAAAIKKEE